MFEWTSSEFHRALHSLLEKAGMDPDEAKSFTSHAFRRGSAADVLASHGLAAMLQHGEWSSVRCATSYASRDEMDRKGMADWVAELSEDDE